MRIAIASTMVAVLVVVQTGLAGLCFCAATPAPLEVAEEEHHCCDSAKQDDGGEADVDPAAIHAPCQRGCCETVVLDDVRDRVTPQNPLQPPSEQPTVLPGWRAPTRLAAARYVVADVRERGPPPDPTARRLAQLQTWLC